MSTAKELHVKQGDLVTLLDGTTQGIMNGFGGMLGIPIIQMIGRSWVCNSANATNYEFHPLDDNKDPIWSFKWNFSPDEDAFKEKLDRPKTGSRPRRSRTRHLRMG